MKQGLMVFKNIVKLFVIFTIFFVYNVHSFDLVLFPTNEESGIFKDYLDVSSHEVRTGNGNGICWNIQRYNKIVINGITLFTYPSGGQYPASLTRCERYGPYLSTAKYYGLPFGFLNNLRFIKFDKSDSFFLINTFNKNTINLGATNFFVSNEKVIIYDPINNKFIHKTIDYDTMTLNTIGETLIPNNYINIKNGTVPIYIKNNGWYYIGIDEKVYFLTEDTSILYKKTEENSNITGGFTTGDEEENIIYSNIYGNKLNYILNNKENYINNFGDGKIIFSLTKFNNPNLYFQTNDNKIYKWNLHCQTPNYTNCNLDSGDNNYYCTNENGTKSPNLEKCEETQYKHFKFILPNYSNPFILNNFPYVSQNINAGNELVWKSNVNSCSKTNNILAKITSPSSTGDPVNLNTGEFDYDNTLMQYPGNGLPFEFKINYKNQAYYNGPIGNNFDFNYNMYLVETEDGNMNFHDGKLQAFPFIKTESGYLDNTTIKAKITKINDKYQIEFNDKKIYTFGINKKIESIKDKYSNTLSFQYNTNNELKKIIDTLGREYNVNYYPNTRIQDITDFNGNKVEFIYFTNNETNGNENDLKTIKTTNQTKTKEISFTYTKAETFENSHNIIKLIDSAGNTYVENTYDENDKVLSQKYGSGTINYEYTLNENNKITINKVRDREGNLIYYYYDQNGNTTKKIITTTTGNQIYEYEYNENNKLIKEKNPLGNGIIYKYDTNGNIIEKRQKSNVNNEDNNTEDLVTSFTYDQTFNIPTQIIEPNGKITNFTLDTNGNIIQKEIQEIEDYNGNNLEIIENYEYNSNGQLIKKIDAKGNEENYEYLSGSLVKITKTSPENSQNQESITTQYIYDNFGNIIKITDGEGHITNLNYDEFNLLKKQITPEGIISEYTYNNLNKKTQEKIILGNNNEELNISYEYDILDNPTKQIIDIDNTQTKTTITKYDLNGNIIETKDGNQATNQFEYDENGNIIKKTTTPQGEDTTPIIISYQYDLNGRLIKQINPNNSEITYEYDLFNRITKQINPDNTYSTFNYDKSGNVLEVKKYKINGELIYKEINDYDLLNKVIKNKKIVLPGNEEIITKTKYDENGNVVKVTSPQSSPTGEEVATSYSYDSFNRLIETIDAKGNKIQNKYNKIDKPIEKKIIQSNGIITITTYEYDNDARLIKQTNNDGNYTTYTYNNLNQVISKTDENGNITEYKYDYRGKVIEERKPLPNPPLPGEGTKVTKYEYDIAGNMTKVIDSNNNETTYEYDDLNRLIKQTYPDQKFITYEYDINGNLIKKTDPNGTIVENTYDNQNRLTSRNITNGTGVEGVTSELYAYDSLGRLVYGNDNQNNAVSFEYDSLNRLTSETNGGEIISYEYDKNGNLTKLIKPNNEIINYSYDELNRLLNIKNNGDSLVNYTYNGLNLETKKYSNGTQTNYSYDNLLRLSKLSNIGNGTTINDYSYSYDKVGNILTSGIENYKYDSLNQIVEVDYLEKFKDNNKTKYTYDPIGNRTFEENIILKQVKNKDQTKEKIDQFEYEINNLNQYQDIKKIKNNIKQTDEQSENDEELEEKFQNDETGSGIINIGDNETGTGDLNNETGTGELIDENGLIQENSDEQEPIKLEGKLLYDNNGNLIGNMLNNKREYIYTYDYKNRLIKVEKNIKKTEKAKVKNDEEIIKTKILEISYDILGRRIEKKFDNGNYVKYYYSNQNIIQEENYSKNGKLQNKKEYIYGTQVDDVLVMNQIETKTRTIQEQFINEKGKTKTRNVQQTYQEITLYYYHKNHLGSIVAITDKKGNIIEEYEYDIFGKPYTKEKTGKLTNLRKSKIGNTRLFTGREYDQKIGLYYNRARYYSPTFGRFISRDPIDINDNINLYTYVGNNPIMWIDLMGREGKQIVDPNDSIINRDPKSEERIMTLDPLIREDVREFLDKVYKDLEINLRVTQAMRTIEVQNDLYNQGRTTSGNIVTRVRGGYSYHNYGLAFDIVKLDENLNITYDTDWSEIGKVGEDIGFEWGGNWNPSDRPHFQKTFGYSTSELKKMFDDGEIDDNGFIIFKG